MLYPKLRNSEPVLGWIDTNEDWDTYFNIESPPTEPVRCPSCGNIYRNKQWYKKGQVKVDETGLEEFLCSACRKVKDQHYRGELTVGGGFLKQHHEEVGNLIVNEIRRRQEKNPLHRLVKVTTEGDRVRFQFTRGKLAERIGRKLKKAYSGRLDVVPSDRITRVDWVRENDPGR